MVRTNVFTSVTIVCVMALAVLPIGATQLTAPQRAAPKGDLQTLPLASPHAPVAASPKDSKPRQPKTATKPVRVRAIVLQDASQAHEVWEEARKSSTDEDFGNLARQYSIDPYSRELLGEIPQNGSNILENEAWRLKPGEVSGIVECGDTFVILRKPTGKRTSLGNSTENVIARVNGEPITVEELAADLLKRYGQEQIDSLVNRKLLEQACRQKGITISDTEIVSEVKQTANKYGLSLDKWYEVLKNERGLHAESYHRDVIWPSLAIKKLAGTVDPEEYFKVLEARAEVLKTGSVFASANFSGQTDSNQTPSRIAFVNVGRIFEESVSFKRRTEKLKAEIEVTRQLLKRLYEETQALQKAIGALAAGKGNDSVKADLEKLLAQKHEQVQEAQRASRKKLRQDESESYLETYRVIYDEVKRYARQHNIDLILRDPSDVKSKSVFESTDPNTVDPKNSQAVMRRINQHVLYVNGAEKEGCVDITEAIIERLKKSDNY